jgi:hypothetical protein
LFAICCGCNVFTSVVVDTTGIDFAVIDVVVAGTDEGDGFGDSLGVLKVVFA